MAAGWAAVGQQGKAAPPGSFSGGCQAGEGGQAAGAGTAAGKGSGWEEAEAEEPAVMAAVGEEEAGAEEPAVMAAVGELAAQSWEGIHSCCLPCRWWIARAQGPQLGSLSRPSCHRTCDSRCPPQAPPRTSPGTSSMVSTSALD